MLIGTIEKHGRWWAASCDIVGAFTQGRSRSEAMQNLAEVVELRVEQRGFTAKVMAIEAQGPRGFSVLIEPSDSARLAAAVLKYQRDRHGMSLADVARKLGVSSRNAYARYEQGNTEPSLGKLRELLRAVAPELTLFLASRSTPLRRRKSGRSARRGVYRIEGIAATSGTSARERDTVVYGGKRKR
jgi:transcriptional regulator with XRE-family HTH domain